MLLLYRILKLITNLKLYLIENDTATQPPLNGKYIIFSRLYDFSRVLMEVKISTSR